VRGAGLTIVSGGVTVGIQIVATVVLARLLAPGDFGVVTMATTFGFLLINFGLNGFTEAVVQCETISHQLSGTFFWVNCMTEALVRKIVSDMPAATGWTRGFL